MFSDVKEAPPLCPSLGVAAHGFPLQCASLKHAGNTLLQISHCAGQCSSRALLWFTAGCREGSCLAQYIILSILKLKLARSFLFHILLIFSSAVTLTVLAARCSAEPVETCSALVPEANTLFTPFVCRRTVTQARARQDEGPQDQQREQSPGLHRQQGSETSLYWSRG